MRIRLLTAGALAAVGLAACSSSGGTTSGSGTTTTPVAPTTSSQMSSTTSGGGNAQAFCGELKTAQKKLSTLANGLSNPMQAGSKLDPIISELQQLKADAPAELQTQFGDLATAFQQVKQAGTGNNLKAIAKQLQKVAPKLEKDGKTIEHYLATKCAGS